MSDRTHQLAARANLAKYEEGCTCGHPEDAPHLKHPALRRLHAQLVGRAFDWAAAHHPAPRVLDLGAGTGSTALPLLELGAVVTAVDISRRQLEALQASCGSRATLETLCQDAFEAVASLQAQGRKYELIVACSFLHHIPDYLGLIGQAMVLLSPAGQFFCFEDPLRYDSLGWFPRRYSRLAHLYWRVFQGDLSGGVRRTLRRWRRVYLDDCPNDYDEYHIIRNGVDQDAILELLRQRGLECELIRYFGTPSRLWQEIAMALGIENRFAILARRDAN